VHIAHGGTVANAKVGRDGGGAFGGARNDVDT